MNPRDNVQHVFYKALHTFCRGILIWRDTDEIPLKSSETADGRVIGRGAHQQEMYVRHSQRLAGESQQRAQETEEHR